VFLKRRSVFLALALALAAPLTLVASAQAQATREYQALLDFASELDNAATAPDFVGLAVAVVKDGQVVLMRTYGVTEAGGTQKVTPDTVFRLASLSKGFAGTLAALEQSEGKLDLQAKAIAYAPQFRLKNAKDTQDVTLEDVLSHQTGLPPYAYDNLLEGGTPPNDILAKYGSVKQTCKPGACFTYQNTTFNIIAAAIQKATGRTYAEELKARILDPLDMKTASLSSQGLKATGNWARPHKRAGEGWTSTPVTEPYYKVPAAGGMNASITDLSKWLVAQMGGRPDVLPQAVLDEAHRRRIDTPPESSRQRSLKTPVTSTSYGARLAHLPVCRPQADDALGQRRGLTSRRSPGCLKRRQGSSSCRTRADHAPPRSCRPGSIISLAFRKRTGSAWATCCRPAQRPQPPAANNPQLA
jgi:CubicO group peptidase (beta-lactamase class C family)